MNYHHSNSLSYHPLLRPSLFSLSFHLNPSLHYPGTLIYQCFLPLKPSILPVWVSICYKHAFTHKPQLPEHFLLSCLLTLHHRERESTTHWLSNNNPSLPTNHHRPAIPVIAAQGPQGAEPNMTDKHGWKRLPAMILALCVRVWWNMWMWLFRVSEGVPLLSITSMRFSPSVGDRKKRQRCEPEVP